MWWLRRSIRTTSASECRSACAAAIPAKPPPMITMRLRSEDGTSTAAVAWSPRVSTNIALMDHLIRDEAVCVWHSHFRQCLRVKDGLPGYDVVDIKKEGHDRVHLIGSEALR